MLCTAKGIEREDNIILFKANLRVFSPVKPFMVWHLDICRTASATITFPRGYGLLGRLF